SPPVRRRRTRLVGASDLRRSQPDASGFASAADAARARTALLCAAPAQRYRLWLSRRASGAAGAVDQLLADCLALARTGQRDDLHRRDRALPARAARPTRGCRTPGFWRARGSKAASHDDARAGKRRVLLALCRRRPPG